MYAVTFECRTEINEQYRFIGFLSIDLILPAPTMALGSTQPLTEIFPGVKGARRLRVTPSSSVSRLPRYYGSLNMSQPYVLPRPVTGIALPFLILIIDE
jgi:hypothetical protein